MSITYRIINKKTDELIRRQNARDVAIYMLGRRYSNYLIVKSSIDGDILFDTKAFHPDVQRLEEHLERLEIAPK